MTDTSSSRSDGQTVPLLTVPVQDMETFARQMSDINRSASLFSSALNTGLKSAVQSGKSLEGTFRQIALSLSSKLLSASLAPLEKLAGSAVSSLSGSLTGSLTGAFGSVLSGSLSALSAKTSVTPFAKGGVVASPTYFGMGMGMGGGAGGAATGLGLAGEAGPEAIVPLARGADGRLGISGGRQAGAGQSININIAARDVEGFRRSEAQVSAMVARAVSRGRRGL